MQAGLRGTAVTNARTAWTNTHVNTQHHNSPRIRTVQADHGRQFWLGTIRDKDVPHRHITRWRHRAPDGAASARPHAGVGGGVGSKPAVHSYSQHLKSGLQARKYKAWLRGSEGQAGRGKEWGAGREGQGGT